MSITRTQKKIPLSALTPQTDNVPVKSSETYGNDGHCQVEQSLV